MRLETDAGDSCSATGCADGAGAPVAAPLPRPATVRQKSQRNGCDKGLPCTSPRSTHATDSTCHVAAVCAIGNSSATRSEEHTSELQSQSNLVCRLLLEKKNKNS